MDPEPCPYLPVPDGMMTAASLAPFAEEKGAAFYSLTLLYGQQLWLQGLPARALLMLNHALGCDLRGDEPELRQWPLPYRAIAWILQHHRPEQFIGNPRRHWQHLATRMSGPRPELRAARAWACWHLARIVLPSLPADETQLAAEGILEPGADEIAASLESLGHPGETSLWRETLAWCRG